MASGVASSALRTMVVAPGRPRDVLPNENEFGVPNALFNPVPVDPRGRALLARAYQQHLFAIEVANELRRQGRSRAWLAGQIGRDAGTLGKELSGHRWLPEEVKYAIVDVLDRVELLPAPSSYSELLPS